MQRLQGLWLCAVLLCSFQHLQGEQWCVSCSNLPALTAQHGVQLRCHALARFIFQLAGTDSMLARA